MAGRSRRARSTRAASPGEPRLACQSRPTGASEPDGLPDAAEVLVDVDDQGAHDNLLGTQGRRVREDGPALRQLLVAQGANRRGCRRRALLEERARLHLAAARVLLGMLGIHLV